MKDKQIEKLIELENTRQNSVIDLIASENRVSNDILIANGSILTNKYAEGYPGARYYGGCEFVDQVENLAIERLKKLFNAKFANVQSHSGSQANAAAYMALMDPGGKILGLSLQSGGHLTHGYFVSFSGKIYESKSYDVDKDTNLINYDEVEKIALEFKPNVIVCGTTSYSRIIDFKKFKQIADKCGAYLMADIAHISGLVVTNLHPSPLPYADVITSTTQKSLRGPRGGFILTNNKELAQKIDKAVFPGIQGGPLMNTIAAKAIAFNEALSNDFIIYHKQVLKNMKAMENEFNNLNIKMLTNGTDNHLLTIDVKFSYKITGKQAEDALLKVNIVVNKNTIPFDSELPSISSGIRIGGNAMTTLGFKENDFIKISNLIDETLKNISNENKLDIIKDRVRELLGK